MTAIVRSISDIPIRLTDERWAHIAEEHGEMAGLRAEILETVANPQRIFLGNDGERLAAREYSPGKYLVAVYREEKEDGFMITAFMTRRIQSLERRRQLWP
ncbi:MAG: PBECR2 nuclease fold domain-containing protein [Candidatus Omnitrophota bacterium]